MCCNISAVKSAHFKKWRWGWYSYGTFRPLELLDHYQTLCICLVAWRTKPILFTAQKMFRSQSFFIFCMSVSSSYFLCPQVCLSFYYRTAVPEAFSRWQEHLNADLFNGSDNFKSPWYIRRQTQMLQLNFWHYVKEVSKEDIKRL